MTNKTTPEKIGPYRIDAEIGRGGMGVVYRAFDQNIHRHVAIKMLLCGAVEDNDTVSRFFREVRATANLQHKNIVTVHTFDQYDGQPYMVMEYLEGESMAALIRSRAALDLSQKLNLFCQVCEGLQYAHENGVVHRDVKPANVLVLANGVAKIVDFGIARVGQDNTITRTGNVMGSINYMSPEQIYGHKVDARTDVYSAGVLLYEFLTGNVPFETPESPGATFFKILNDPVPSLAYSYTSYPRRLDEILQKAMAKDAAHRFQSARELGEAVKRVEQSLNQNSPDDFALQNAGFEIGWAAEQGQEQLPPAPEADQGMGVAGPDSTTEVMGSQSGEGKGRGAVRRPRRLYAFAAVAVSISLAGACLFIKKVVIVQPDPPDAFVTIDGQPCANPCRIGLRPGGHDIAVGKVGYKGSNQRLAVPFIGEVPVSIVSLRLVQEPPPATTTETPIAQASAAKISISTSVPQASVFLDDLRTPAGVTGELGQLELSTVAGTHRLRVEKAGFVSPPQQRIRVTEGGEASATFTLNQMTKPDSPLQQASYTPPQSSPVENKPPQLPTAPQTDVANKPPVPAPTDTFAVSPDSISPGRTAELKWATQNADEVTIDGERVERSGSKTISPTASRKFTLIAKGSGGSNRDEVYLNVRPEDIPPKPVTANASISDQDKTAIQAVLNRYSDVFAKRKAKNLKDIWTTVPSGKISEIQSFIDTSKNLTLTIVPQKWDLHGTGILVTCQQTQSFLRNGKPTNQTGSITFYMVKSQGSWIISDIPVSAD